MTLDHWIGDLRVKYLQTMSGSFSCKDECTIFLIFLIFGPKKQSKLKTVCCYYYYYYFTKRHQPSTCREALKNSPVPAGSCAGVSSCAHRDLHLQKIRHLVRVLRQKHPLHRLGAPGQGQRLSPGLLRLLLLQEAAVYRGGVRPGGGEGALQGPLRLHAG